MLNDSDGDKVSLYWYVQGESCIDPEFDFIKDQLFHCLANRIVFRASENVDLAHASIGDVSIQVTHRSILRFRKWAVRGFRRVVVVSADEVGDQICKIHTDDNTNDSYCRSSKSPFDYSMDFDIRRLQCPILQWVLSEYAL